MHSVVLHVFIMSLLTSYFKTKTLFFGINPIINRDKSCSSNMIVLNNHLALRNFIWNAKYSTLYLWFDLFLF
ncbi:hypothetical protein EHE65_13255 [Salmonella enterica subsp. enterica]|nr:hypothetical protein [Salmonella enterica subsp. enterica]